MQKIDVKELIPKDKFDHKVIPELKKLPFEQLKPIIPQLLEWLQDMNWPIAKHVADILKPFVDRIIPEIVKVLQTNDGMWELWVLVQLARNTTDPLLLLEIERIATSPTKIEIDDGVQEEAISILNGDYKQPL